MRVSTTIAKRLRPSGGHAIPSGGDCVRLVMYHNITTADVERTIAAFHEVMA